MCSDSENLMIDILTKKKCIYITRTNIFENPVGNHQESYCGIVVRDEFNRIKLMLFSEKGEAFNNSFKEGDIIYTNILNVPVNTVNKIFRLYNDILKKFTSDKFYMVFGKLKEQLNSENKNKIFSFFGDVVNQIAETIKDNYENTQDVEFSEYSENQQNKEEPEKKDDEYKQEIKGLKQKIKDLEEMLNNKQKNKNKETSKIPENKKKNKEGKVIKI